MSSNKPLVSVIMITYNHEKFIAEAIEGILMQETNFAIELIIADDHSPDNTYEVVGNFITNHPKGQWIKYIRHPNNLGMANNFMDAFNRCQGKFIAMCEGDDYWIEPFKLQKQVDFLERNPEFAICFHNSKIIYEDDSAKTTFSNSDDQKEVSGFEDLTKGEFIYTATCIFKRVDLMKFPKKHFRFINNYTLDLHNAQFGGIKYMNEVMSVYRKHRGGVWSMISREKVLIEHLPAYKFYVDYFDKKYKEYFLYHVRSMTIELMSIALNKGNLKSAWSFYFDFVFYNIRNRSQIRRVISVSLRMFRLQIRKSFWHNA